MSDASGGQGWWRATNGKWYPPEMHPTYVQRDTAPPTASVAPGARDTSGLLPGLDEELAVYRDRAPGWYRDSTNPDNARYWDGTNLSEERRAIAAPSTRANAQEPGGRLVSKERGPDMRLSFEPPPSPRVSARPPTSRTAMRASRTLRQRRVIAGGVLVVALVVVAAAALFLVNSFSNSTNTVTGTVDVVSQGTFALGRAGTGPCDVPPTDGGEKDGEKITVINTIGKALGTGTFSNSVVTPDGRGCRFSFTVRSVPSSSSSYSVTFGDRMGTVYSLSAMEAANWTMAVSVTP
jgi:Protein of unknown function (DUF2510)